MLFRKNDLCVTKFDYERLIKILNKILKRHNSAGKISDINNAEKLLNQIKSARKVDSKEIPDDCVTMNSILELKNLGVPQKLKLRLVFPDDANGDNSQISILAPIGAALLGSRKGKVIRWDTPVGDKYYQINKIIYQPEASGDYHL